MRDTFCEYVVPMTRGTKAIHPRGGKESSIANEQGPVTLGDMVSAAGLAALSLPEVSSSMLRYELLPYLLEVNGNLVVKVGL